MSKILLKNVQAFGPDRFLFGDILIEDQYISRIDRQIDVAADEVIDCTGLLVLPGLIDEHVHFREPGMTQKATIYSESRAAALGGVTSFMEMPNTNPATTTMALLNEKKAIAQRDSLVNYSFYLGASEYNLEDVKKADPHEIAAVKVFMGSTTGNLLLDDEHALIKIFKAAPTLISTHCEDNGIVNANTVRAKNMYGEHIPFDMHPIIRSRECCIKSSQLAMDAALATGARLHIMHLTTKDEIEMIRPYAKGDIYSRQITGEVCIPHLYFNDANYEKLKGFLKCNPAVKYEIDRLALIKALKEGVITTIGTDHAPHELAVKEGDNYLKVASGLPSVQFSFNALFNLFKRHELTLESIVRGYSANVAKRYAIEKRGALIEGYYADIAIVNPNDVHTVTKDEIASPCGWSPFTGERFISRVVHTIASGKLVVRNSQICADSGDAMALRFHPEI